MKRYPILTVLALSAICLTACDEDYMAITNPDAGKGKKAETPEYILHPLDWTSVADSVSSALVTRFFNQSGAAGVFCKTSYNNLHNNDYFYWQQPHAMAAMIDWHDRIEQSNPTLAAQLEGYMSDFYSHQGNNWAPARFRGPYGFGNNYSDDTAWQIIGLLQMFEATGDPRYFEAAEGTWVECIRPRFARNEYGWLIWLLDHAQEGKTEKEGNALLACTHGPASICASMLAAYAREAGDDAAYETYFNEASRCFDQNLSIMSPLGTVTSPGEVALSYTQGTCMEAGRLLWKLSGEAGYLRKAIMAARGQMGAEMCEVYNGEFVMRNEGTDYNNAVFHAVWYHWASRMATDREIDRIDPSIRQELKTFIQRHCWYYWKEGVNRSDWEDSYFSTTVYRPRAKGSGGEMGAYASAAQAMEAMCLIEKEF